MRRGPAQEREWKQGSGIYAVDRRRRRSSPPPAARITSTTTTATISPVLELLFDEAAFAVVAAAIVVETEVLLESAFDTLPGWELAPDEPPTEVVVSFAPAVVVDAGAVVGASVAAGPVPTPAVGTVGRMITCRVVGGLVTTESGGCTVGVTPTGGSACRGAHAERSDTERPDTERHHDNDDPVARTQSHRKLPAREARILAHASDLDNRRRVARLRDPL